MLGDGLHDGMGEHSGVKGESSSAFVRLGHGDVDEGSADSDGRPMGGMADVLFAAQVRECIGCQEDTGVLVCYAWGLVHGSLREATALEEALGVVQVGWAEEAEAGLIQRDQLCGCVVLVADKGVFAFQELHLLGHKDLGEELSHAGFATVGSSPEPNSAFLLRHAHHKELGDSLDQRSETMPGGHSGSAGDRARQRVSIAELLKCLTHGFHLAGGSSVGDEVVTDLLEGL